MTTSRPDESPSKAKVLLVDERDFETLSRVADALERDREQPATTPQASDRPDRASDAETAETGRSERRVRGGPHR